GLRAGSAGAEPAGGLTAAFGEPGAGKSRYPREYLLNRGGYTPADPQRQLSSTEPRTVASTSGAGKLRNLVANRSAALFSPYEWDFKSSDDIHAAGRVIRNSKSCPLRDWAALVNNTDLYASDTLGDKNELVAFVNRIGPLGLHKGWTEFAYVHLTTHGDTFYKGLTRKHWLKKWGPIEYWKRRGELTGLATVGLDTGLSARRTPGIEEDIKQKRIAVGPGGALALLPGFFKRHLSNKGSNTIVVLANCRGAYNNTLIDVLLSKGVGAVIAFNDYVLSGWAQDITQSIAESLLDGKTLQTAFDQATSRHGKDDGRDRQIFEDPAKIFLRGNGDLRLAPDGVVDGGFESGSFLPWWGGIGGDASRHVERSVRGEAGNPYARFEIRVVDGDDPFHHAQGGIDQNICMPSGVLAFDLTFRWKFDSDLFTTKCHYEDSDGETQELECATDEFSVHLCEQRPSGGECSRQHLQQLFFVDTETLEEDSVDRWRAERIRVTINGGDTRDMRLAFALRRAHVDGSEENQRRVRTLGATLWLDDIAITR
ncbi:MAG: hypothetical protein OXU72_12705, partial [Gammaproteobacteria bacterium]|nr:hypothetical protein [Gammaproteobacteria bacterium]